MLLSDLLSEFLRRSMGVYRRILEDNRQPRSGNTLRHRCRWMVILEAISVSKCVRVEYAACLKVGPTFLISFSAPMSGPVPV